MSWGTLNCIAPVTGANLCLPLESALYIARDIPMVAAAGNDNTNKIMFPASSPHVIAVGGISSSGTRWTSGTLGSNTGNEIDVVASTGVLVALKFLTGLYPDCYPQDYYCASEAATSGATAQVAGIVALMLSKCDELTKSEIGQILNSTATDFGGTGWDSTFGWGRVNAEAALNEIDAC